MFAQTTPNNNNNNHSAPAEKLLFFIHDALQSSLHNKWLILILHQPIKGEIKPNLLLWYVLIKCYFFLTVFTQYIIITLINLGRSQHGSPCLVWQCRGHLCWHIQCVFQCCSKLVMVLFSFRLLYSCTNTHTAAFISRIVTQWLFSARTQYCKSQTVNNINDIHWSLLSSPLRTVWQSVYWVLMLTLLNPIFALLPVQVQCTGAQIYHRSPPNKQNLECKQAQV